MQIALPTPGRKAIFLTGCLSISALYVGLCARQFMAAYFSAQPDLASLQKAILLEPGRAEYQYRLGQYYSYAEPESAVRFYKSAVALNPHQAIYWLDLSRTYQLAGNANQQENALKHAIAADPTNPEVAWDAANLYWAEGDADKALQEFRVVLEHDPYLPPKALERCWQIQPDVDALLRDAIPHRADVVSAFLDFLISKKETVAAAKVWNQLAQFQQPVERRHVFDYIRYLLEQRNVAQARLVWQQAAGLSDLNDYQPSPENLVINGDFSLPVLNAGFDWLYERKPDVSLALDPTQSHSGYPSLSVVFDSAGMEDAGLRQLIPVEPNTRYEFSAYFKAEDIQGVGGPQFVIADQFAGITYFASDELKDADFWKPITGAFDTGPNATLLALRLQREPAGHPIRGKLWIAGIRLAQAPFAENVR